MKKYCVIILGVLLCPALLLVLLVNKNINLLLGYEKEGA
jgi:hypothetical protein